MVVSVLSSSVGLALNAPTLQIVGETISGVSGTTHSYVAQWKDNSTDEDVYLLDVQFNGSGPYYNVNVSLANNDVLTWTMNDSLVQDLANGTLLNFRVRAANATFNYNTAGNPTSVKQIIGTPVGSNIKSLNFSKTSTQTLQAPTGLTVAAVDDGNVRITFIDNCNREDAYQVLIKKSTDANFPTDHDGFSLTFNVNDYTVSNRVFLYKETTVGTGADQQVIKTSGLEPGTTYNIKIRAIQIVYDAQGNPSISATTGYSNVATIATPPLVAPASLLATQIDETKVNLTWLDNSRGEHGYLLQWKEVGTDDSTFQTVTGTASDVTNYELKSSELAGLLLPGYPLVWRVATAYNPASNTSGSAANYIQVPGNQVTTSTKFNPPVNLQATSSSEPTNNAATTVNLTWEDKSARETGYRVLGRVVGAASFSVLQDLAANTTATSFTISNPGSAYEIKVIGFYDSSGSILSTTGDSNVVNLALKNAFTSKLDQVATVGSAFSYQISTSGAAARTNLAVSGLPDGLTFTSGNAQIAGTPEDGGLFNITMTASFNDGWTVTAPLALRVMHPESSPTRPVVVTTRRMAPGTDSVMALSDLFADKDTQDVRRLTTNKGNIDVVLFTAQTPATVSNFKAYTDNNRYNGAVFHRNSPGFVLQGGGYKPTGSPKDFAEVEKLSSPVNEPGIPNIRGTLSLAKGGTPNSGSHDFFINLADNRSILDENTGGFTVFGRVAKLQSSPSITPVVDTILALPGRQDYTINLTPSGSTTVESNFNPIGSSGLGAGTIWPIDDTVAPATMDNTKMVQIQSVSTLSPLTYEITTAPNSGVATATLNGANFVITGVAEGQTFLTITAYDVDGNATLQEMTINVDPTYEPVEITLQPLAVIANVGDNISFVVAADGTNPTYQWRRNGKDIPGATQPTLAINGVALSHGGSYSVAVSNEQSREVSNAVLLTLHAPPSFTSPAVTQNVSKDWGSNITFSPVATGDAVISYQWKKNGENLTGKTGPSLTLSTLVLGDAGSYTVRATNGYGFADSPAFVLTVNPIDSDGDGLLDHEELARVPPTDRMLADTDSDGYSDGVEVTLGTNPNSATSNPGATKFVASRDGAAALAALKFKWIPKLETTLFPNRLNGGALVSVPDRWLSTYELTNEQFATLLDHAWRIMDVIEVVDLAGRKAVRYPKTSGQVVCYLNDSGDPPSCDIEFDATSHTFIVAKTLGKMPVRAVSWYGAYVATLALNNIYEYPDINVPATLAFNTSKKGFIIPTSVEWEWAARGGLAAGFNGTTNFGFAYPTGTGVSTALAKYADLTATAKPKNVGSYAASKLGFYDLGGNVAEWVYDGDSTNGHTRGGAYNEPAPGEALKNVSFALVGKNTISRTIGVRIGMIETVAPLIAPSLAPQLVKVGSPINVTVNATGAPPLSYQWYKNGALLKGKTGTSISIPSAQLTDAGAYMVKVIGNGATSSSTANVAVVEVLVPTPAYYVVPNKKTTIPLRTAVAPGQVLQYEWTLGGSSLSSVAQITGDTTNTLVINPALSALEGSYQCTVKLPIPNPLFPPIVANYFVVVYDTPQVLVPLVLPYGVVGTTFSFNGEEGYQVPYNTEDSRLPTLWTITGLPKGMTYNRLTGVISGRPAGPGEWALKITASNPFDVGDTKSATLKVSGYPGGITGAYTARVERHSLSVPGGGTTGVNEGLGGKLDFALTGNGYYTATLMLGASPYKFTGYLEPTVNSSTGVVGTSLTSNVVVPRKGKLPVKLALTFDSTTNRFTGSVGELAAGSATPASTAAITGWRNRFTAIYTPTSNNRGGYHTFSLGPPSGQINATTVPQGATYGSIKMLDSGAANVAGRTADGTSYTTSSYLGPAGEVIVFQALYGGKGSLFGTLNVSDTTGHPITVLPSVTWLRKNFGEGSIERNYELGFGPLSLELILGGTYTPPAANTPVMGLPITDGPTPAAANNAQLDFTSGGLPAAINWPFRISKANLAVMPGGNTQAIAFKVDKATGIFNGTFVQTNTDPVSNKPLPRKVTYYGIITPSPAGSTTGIGHGYFTLPLLPNAAPDAHTKDNSDILSGKVRLSKLPAGP